MLAQSTSPWHALRVRTGSEELAASGLAMRGYQPFVATYHERRRYSDRMKTVVKPTFPGYVFCRFDVRHKSLVLSSPAVLHALQSCSGVIACIHDAEIEAIKTITRAGGQPTDYLEVGKRVRVECGPLAGIEGLLARVESENRLVLTVHLLQRSVFVRINADQITAID